MEGNANGHILVSRAAKSIRWAQQYREPMEEGEAKLLVDTLLRDLWDDVKAERAAKGRAVYVKNLSAAIGITIDKKQLLANRPTQIVQVQDQARPVLRGLGLKLARLDVPRGTPPSSDQQP